MKIFKARPVFFRIYLIMLICLSFGAYPLYKYALSLEGSITKLQSEQKGVEMLSSIEKIAHGVYLKRASSPLYEKGKSEYLSEINKLATNARVFLNAQHSDSIKKSYMSRNLFTPLSLNALFDVKENAEKSVPISDMCKFALVQSDLSIDENSSANIIANLSGDDFAQVYTSIYKISRLLSIYSDMDEKTAANELLSAYSLFDDDIRSMLADLRRVVSSSSTKLSTSMTAAIVKLANTADLNISLGKAWTTGSINIVQAQTSLDNLERALSELWSICNENLLISIEERRLAYENELNFFMIVLGLSLFGIVLVSIVILLPFRKFWKDISDILRLAVAGRMKDAMEKCERRRRENSEFALLSDNLEELVNKCASALERAEKVAEKMADFERMTSNLAQAQKPVMSELETAIRFAQTKFSTHVAGAEEVAHSIIIMRDELLSAEQNLRAKMKAAGDLSEDLRETLHRVESLTKDLEKARSLAERMTNVAETFTGIADQANILSLNLSIAATKAGMKLSGMGTLSEQISLLSKQITVSVLDIESVRDAVVEALDGGVKASEHASELLEGDAKISAAANSFLDLSATNLSNIAMSANTAAGQLRERITADYSTREAERSLESVSSALTSLSGKPKSGI